MGVKEKVNAVKVEANSVKVRVIVKAKRTVVEDL